jgi:hypothetical protein
MRARTANRYAALILILLLLPLGAAVTGWMELYWKATETPITLPAPVVMDKPVVEGDHYVPPAPVVYPFY